MGDEPGRTRATLTCCSGTSELDGPVDVVVVAEEAGIGLGARCAGTLHDDPGDEVGIGPPTWLKMVRPRRWEVCRGGAEGKYVAVES